MKYKLFGVVCAAIVLAVIVLQCSRGLSGPAMKAAELAAAITQARNGLNHFRAELEKGTDRAYFLRGSFKDAQGRMDLLWVKRVKPAKDGFSGIVDQEPTIITTVHKGDEVKVSSEDVVDWNIIHTDGSHEGAFTVGLEPVRH